MFTLLHMHSSYLTAGGKRDLDEARQEQERIQQMEARFAKVRQRVSDVDGLYFLCKLPCVSDLLAAKT